LGENLAGNVLPIKDEQFEDFALGTFMNKVKTNETVSRKDIYRIFPK
jgi:hypothetical protein